MAGWGTVSFQLPAGLRLVAFASVALGSCVSLCIVAHLLTTPSFTAMRELYLTLGMIAGCLLIVCIGLGLFRMNFASWLAFWVVGLATVACVAEQLRWQKLHHEQFDQVYFLSGVALGLWYVTTAVVLLLPSARQFFFNEPDSVWMHKKVFRSHAETSGSVSGRPRTPVGVHMLGYASVTGAALLFVKGMQSVVADPDPTTGEAVASNLETAGLVLASVLLGVVSVGLFRVRRWAWFGLLIFALGAIGFTGFEMAQPSSAPEETAEESRSPLAVFLLCVVWGGAAIVYLCLPVVRHAFFSRRRSGF